MNTSAIAVTSHSRRVSSLSHRAEIGPIRMVNHRGDRRRASQSVQSAPNHRVRSQPRFSRTQRHNTSPQRSFTGGGQLPARARVRPPGRRRIQRLCTRRSVSLLPGVWERPCYSSTAREGSVPVNDLQEPAHQARRLRGRKGAEELRPLHARTKPANTLAVCHAGREPCLNRASAGTAYACQGSLGPSWLMCLGPWE